MQSCALMVARLAAEYPFSEAVDADSFKESADAGLQGKAV
jgi:hypothetical protein